MNGLPYHALNPRMAEIFPASAAAGTLSTRRPPASAIRPYLSLSPDEKKLLDENVPLLAAAMPDGVDKSRDKITNVLQAFGEAARAPLLLKLAEGKRINNANADSFKKMHADLDALRIELQAAHAETRAAAEGRGVHENKRLTDLLAANEAKAREIDRLKSEAHAQTVELGRLKNEITARAVVVTAHEREKAELLGAALITAQAMRTARAFLANSRDNIADRYGAQVTPFLGTIRADILGAIAALPATI